MATQLTIAGLIDEGHLQRMPGRAADAPAFLDKAREFLVAAEWSLRTYLEPAFVLSFSAVRLALLGVLAHRGLALTETVRDRSDQDNDNGIIAAAMELVGRERFPELDAFRETYEDREYGPFVVDQKALFADTPHWVSVATAIVEAAENLIGGPATAP